MKKTLSFGLYEEADSAWLQGNISLSLWTGLPQEHGYTQRAIRHLLPVPVLAPSEYMTSPCLSPTEPSLVHLVTLPGNCLLPIRKGFS
jgi:hypothetical protein